MIDETEITLLSKVSSEVGPWLKRFMKVPMVFLCIVTGFTGGTSLVLFKCFGTVLTEREAKSNTLLTVLLSFVAVALAPL